MLAETGTEYADRILTKKMFAELKEEGQLLFQQVPLLEIDGLKLVQSGAAVRYLARKHGLYGSTAEEAVQCDMMYDALHDFINYCYLPYPFQADKPNHLEEKVVPKLPRYLQPFSDILAKNNGGEKKGFLLGDKLSFPDLLLLEAVEYTHELLPSHLTSYPFLVAFRQRMLERPSMKQFYATGRHRGTPDDKYAAHVSEVLGWK